MSNSDEKFVFDEGEYKFGLILEDGNDEPDHDLERDLLGEYIFSLGETFFEEFLKNSNKHFSESLFTLLCDNHFCESLGHFEHPSWFTRLVSNVNRANTILD